MSARPSQPCPGAGRAWATWQDEAQCPVCHRWPWDMGALAPVRKRGEWAGAVPAHDDGRSPHVREADCARALSGAQGSSRGTRTRLGGAQ